MVKVVTVSENDVAENAAHVLVEALEACIQDTGQARFAISGGSALAPVALVRQVLGPKWQLIKLTWVDERCVEVSHPDSNRGTAYKCGALTDESPTALELPLWIDGETPQAASQRVQDSLVADFQNALDVVLLGMGPDGHIASLFPGHQALLSPQKDRVTFVPDSPKAPLKRMTLTIGMLKTAKQSIMVATGPTKVDALTRLLRGDASLPAHQLANLTIVTDQHVEE